MRLRSEPLEYHRSDYVASQKRCWWKRCKTLSGIYVAGYQQRSRIALKDALICLRLGEWTASDPPVNSRRRSPV
jgi:hypothetical protein